MRVQEPMKVLHENKFGHIAKCSCCEELQLSLGNVLLTFSEEEYLQFDQFFDEIRSDIADGKPYVHSKRKYVVVTNYNGVVLSLTHSELLKTIELLNFSTMMISVTNLMESSEKN